MSGEMFQENYQDIEEPDWKEKQMCAEVFLELFGTMCVKTEVRRWFSRDKVSRFPNTLAVCFAAPHMDPDPEICDIIMNAYYSYYRTSRHLLYDTSVRGL